MPSALPRLERVPVYHETTNDQVRADVKYKSFEDSIAEEAARDSVPTIVTQRLILRPHRQTDLPACLALWNDPEVSRSLLKGKGSSEQEVWFRILRYSGLWSLLGFGYFAVTEKQSGTLIGEVGFADFKRATIPTLGDDPEVGWAIRSECGGMGFATEAVAAALAWFDRRHGGRRSICVIGPSNGRSIRVAQRNGYHAHGRCRMEEAELLLFERTPDAGGTVR